LSKHCFFCFFKNQADVYTYSFFSVEKHRGPLSQTEGIPLVQQRQNTMFRLIKKKIETLLKQRTAEKHFGIYLVSYLAKVHKHYAFLRRHGLKHTQLSYGYVQNIELAAALLTHSKNC